MGGDAEVCLCSEHTEGAQSLGGDVSLCSEGAEVTHSSGDVEVCLGLEGAEVADLYGAKVADRYGAEVADLYTSKEILFKSMSQHEILVHMMVSMEQGGYFNSQL